LYKNLEDWDFLFNRKIIKLNYREKKLSYELKAYKIFINMNMSKLSKNLIMKITQLYTTQKLLTTKTLLDI